MVPRFSYFRANSIPDAVRCLLKDGAHIHAGGTDLLGCARDGVFNLSTVVSISGIEALKGIHETPEGGLRIGALTTISEIAGNPLVAAKYRALSMAAAKVASPQLRNQGNIGGNLCQKPRCWYYRGEFNCLRKGGDRCYALEGENRYHCIFGGANCYIVHPSDTAPALVALGASVTIEGPKGRRSVSVEKFHVPPAVDFTVETVLKSGEIVTEIILPPPTAGLRSAYRKVRAGTSLWPAWLPPSCLTRIRFSIAKWSSTALLPFPGVSRRRPSTVNGWMRIPPQKPRMQPLKKRNPCLRTLTKSRCFVQSSSRNLSTTLNNTWR